LYKIHNGVITEDDEEEVDFDFDDF